MRPSGCRNLGSAQTSVASFRPVRQSSHDLFRVVLRRKKGRTKLCVVPCAAKRGRKRALIQSDGQEHLGSSQTSMPNRNFPGPPGAKGPPLRVLPIGGLGEIGMNCMLVGVFDRYILIDAGLMFPDVSDMGMQRILPDTSFLAQWKDKIEALVITHGHEDHIGAIPWVLPALDPSTPVYASGFVMQLLRNRLVQYNLWEENRFHTFEMRDRIEAGPFELEPIRVTHSIPDCCGLILRSEHGTILHTGDWKIDEDPVDGHIFDRSAFEEIGKEGVTLMMSDSTNVLSPGRTISESIVRRSLADKVLSWDGKGRIISTMFASNLHRIGSIKAAADAAGRKLCFIGMSLHSYLEAAVRSGNAPFDPRELVNANELEDIDPNDVLVVTTGSQAEPRAALSLAANAASYSLKLTPEDMLIYSAKIIPGNEKRVMRMMNKISNMGTEIAMGRNENLHASGHGYKEELAEIIKLVQPQHFLPVHGESLFLSAHAELAKELGVQRTRVIHDGEMLGVKHLMKKRTVSIGSMGSMKVLGTADITRFFNDGNNGTGTHREMAIYERNVMATEGMVVAAADVYRPPGFLSDDPDARLSLRARVRITTRGLWTDKGKLVRQMCQAAQSAVARCPADSSLIAVEKTISSEVRKTSRRYNKRTPEVIVIAHEHDPRAGAALDASQRRQQANEDAEAGPNSSRKSRSGGPAKETGNTRKTKRGGKQSAAEVAAAAELEELDAMDKSEVNGKLKDEGGGKGPGDLVPVPDGMIERMREQNPREKAEGGVEDLDYG